MSEAGRIEVAIRHRLGGLALDVVFTLSAPWTVLFAPSGAGKSTVLRIIGGLVRPSAGRISAGGMILTDAEERVFVPPHRRQVRFVGQQAALFPHRSVRENVMYGMTGAEAGRRRLLGEILALCRVEHVAGKMPGAISGGERQRVALARALGAGVGRLVLLDEPFSGLDVGLRDELLRDLKGWIAVRGAPVLQVTHDVGEVFALGAEVIRMEGGRVVAQGPAAVVLREQRATLLEQLRAD